MDIMRKIVEADRDYYYARTAEYIEAERRIQEKLDTRNRLMAQAVDEGGVSIRQMALALGKKNPTGVKKALEAGRAL